MGKIGFIYDGTEYKKSTPVIFNGSGGYNKVVPYIYIDGTWVKCGINNNILYRLLDINNNPLFDNSNQPLYTYKISN